MRWILTVGVALFGLNGALLAQAAASHAQWREARAELQAKVKNTNPNIRADACASLARFNVKGATELILQAVECAERDLLRLGNDLTDLYKDWEKTKVDWRVIEKDQRQRIARYRIAQERFREHYERTLSHLRARDRIAGDLGKVSDPVSVKLLERRLRHYSSKKNWIARATIVDAFATIKSPLVEQALLDLCNKKTAGTSYDVRIALRALKSLARQRTLSGDKAIVEALQTSEHWQVRAAAIQVCGEYKILKAVPVLEKILAEEIGRLRRDAADALGEIQRTRRREYQAQARETTYPCLDLWLPSRNVMFMISAGFSMADLWDDTTDPQIDSGDNRPKFEIAKAGVKGYLRTIINEYDDLADPDEDFVPFRFNICVFRGYSEFYEKKGMCEINSMADVTKLDAAIKWLDWEDGEERRAVGEANLVEALDKCFSQAGFGPRFEEVNFEREMDTLVILSDTAPNAGAFKYDPVVGGSDREALSKCWQEIGEFLAYLNNHREVRIAAINVGMKTVSSSAIRGLAHSEHYSLYSPSKANAAARRAAILRKREEER